MIWRCDLIPQYETYQQEIHEAIENVLHSGHYILGENVAFFEKEFAAYIGCKYGIGVNSGTDALVLALECFNLQPGDEVITTSFTAIPTYAAIRHAGAKPVFVDIDRDTFLMDLNQIEKVLTPRTKAIVPVHLFGNVVDIEQLRQIVGPSIFILEDCAQAHGAIIHNRKAGALGDIAAFSFYPTKNLGGYGDGGMILTNNNQFAEIVKLKRMYGMINKDEFVIDGINSRLDELQAAILRVKLKYLDAMNLRRRELATIYQTQINPDHVKHQKIVEEVNSVYHVYCVLCHRRDDLIEYLKHRDIQTNIYYPMPLPQQKAVKDCYGTLPLFPESEYVSKHILALPFYPEITIDKLEYIASQINDFFGC